VNGAHNNGFGAKVTRRGIVQNGRMAGIGAATRHAMISRSLRMVASQARD
jgi:hypothetical protein